MNDIYNYRKAFALSPDDKEAYALFHLFSPTPDKTYEPGQTYNFDEDEVHTEGDLGAYSVSTPEDNMIDRIMNTAHDIKYGKKQGTGAVNAVVHKVQGKDEIDNKYKTRHPLVKKITILDSPGFAVKVRDRIEKIKIRHPELAEATIWNNEELWDRVLQSFEIPYKKNEKEGLNIDGTTGKRHKELPPRTIPSDENYKDIYYPMKRDVT